MGRKGNNQRSNVKNPNNKAYRDKIVTTKVIRRILITRRIQEIEVNNLTLFFFGGIETGRRNQEYSEAIH